MYVFIYEGGEGGYLQSISPAMPLLAHGQVPVD